MTSANPTPDEPAELGPLLERARHDHRAGRLAEASATYRQLLALRPELAEAHYGLGNIFWRQGQPEAAAQSFEKAIALAPDYADAHNELGILLARHGQFDLAEEQFERVIAIAPHDAKAHINLGNVLREQGKLAGAATRYEQAIGLAPNSPEARYNLGFALWEQGQLDDAAARFEQALALRPDYPLARFGLALCCLIDGDYERGWPLYDQRLRTPNGHVPLPDLPRWTGQPLAGRTLLLVSEQSYGDTFQFVRYARLLKARGARIVLAVQPALGRLLSSQRDVDALFLLGSSDAWPAADFCLPLLSAPGALGTTASSIPCEIPYLAADPDLIERWRAELAQVAGFRIGLAWQAAHEPRTYAWRSIPLASFAPLARLPGVRLISLQKGLGTEQTAAAGFSILDFSERLDTAAGPFMDTAAVIRNLDLVVTIDTSIAHLAGALGAPVFVALPLHNEWRWLRDRDDSPWYPTMRLFRQQTLGQWSDAFERIVQAVQARRSEADRSKSSQ